MSFLPNLKDNPRIIDTLVNHEDKTVCIEIGKMIKQVGAYHFRKYPNISPSSQKRLLPFIQSNSTRYIKYHLITHVGYPIAGRL